MIWIDVIVVSYNSRSRLTSCLSSIENQGEVSTSIVVIDNASTDDGVALVEAQFPNVQLFENADNRGFAAAVNQGLAATTAPFVLLLNPDAALLPSTLAQLVHHLQSQPDVAAVGLRQWLNADRVWQWGIVPRPRTGGTCWRGGRRWRGGR